MYLFLRIHITRICMILPEPDKDSGSVQTLTMIKILLAMRCHVSIYILPRVKSTLCA